MMLVNLHFYGILRYIPVVLSSPFLGLSLAVFVLLSRVVDVDQVSIGQMTLCLPPQVSRALFHLESWSLGLVSRSIGPLLMKPKTDLDFSDVFEPDWLVNFNSVEFPNWT